MQQPISFALGGGLDLVSPPLAKRPGSVISALNYEPVATGYRRLRGYERFDGRTAPSAGGVRANITAVPGTGPVRGVWPTVTSSGATVVVAVRDSSVSAARAYVNTSSGWSILPISYSMAFTSGGTDEIEPGQYISGNTSGAIGHIGRVELSSGSWAGGDAAGTLWFALQSGTFQAENVSLIDSTFTTTISANAATVSGPGTAFGLTNGGYYKFVFHNFRGASEFASLYFVNGVNRGFEFIPSTGVMVPISTGMATDTPTRIAEHRNSLFFAFPGGSVQFSAVGDPHDWSPITGAGELGIGTEITDFAPLPNALAILGDTSIHVLYGSDSSDYQLEGLNEEAGALAHAAQNFGSLIYMDNRGLRSLAAAQKFGNFTTGTISRLIAPLLEDKRRDSVDPSASLVCRTADQYWLFFDDGTGFIVYLGGKEPWILPFNLGITVTCATSVEDDGVERLFVGASNGFVYELNKGTSFDGSAIEHYVALAYNNMGMPQHEKRIHKTLIDVEVSGTTTISAAARFNLGAIDGPDAQAITLTTGGSAIDDLGTGESYYAALTPAVGEVYFDGVFRDISLKISGSQAAQEPHTLTGVTYLVSPRGLRR